MDAVPVDFPDVEVFSDFIDMLLRDVVCSAPDAVGWRRCGWRHDAVIVRAVNEGYDSTGVGRGAAVVFAARVLVGCGRKEGVSGGRGGM